MEKVRKKVGKEVWNKSVKKPENVGKKSEKVQKKVGKSNNNNNINNI